MPHFFFWSLNHHYGALESCLKSFFIRSIFSDEWMTELLDTACFTVYISRLVSVHGVQCVWCWEEAVLLGVRSQVLKVEATAFSPSQQKQSWIIFHVVRKSGWVVWKSLNWLHFYCSKWGFSYGKCGVELNYRTLNREGENRPSSYYSHVQSFRLALGLYISKSFCFKCMWGSLCSELDTDLIIKIACASFFVHFLFFALLLLLSSQVVSSTHPCHFTV